MAESKNQSNTNEGPSLIDPIYQKFTRGIVRALGSEDFYQFFMENVSRADNEIQFSNRKEIKAVDDTWVSAIEAALDGFQHIVATPRRQIYEEELIVNVAHAKKTGQDVVRHLASHASMIENYNDATGDVRPSRVMQKYREDTIGLYENRVVYTTLEIAYHFVAIRYEALFQAMSDEFGAKLKVRSDMDSATEHVHMDMFMHIKKTDSFLDTDDKNREIFDRISRLHRVLGVFMNTDFARQMAQYDRVRGALHKTNVLKRNPDYRAVTQLLEFLRSYDQIGYIISVVEQNPIVNETLQQDIFHNILFNYIVLKGYLEDEEDREVPLARKPKQRKLRPKFIHEIIEELTEDYDLPDVEVRKVLIEELTKEQLMLEEEAERRRLVEEQEQRKREEEERLRAEKEAEEARIQAEKEAEEERLRQEREAEEKRLLAERMLREADERRRIKLFQKELDAFEESFLLQLDKRREAAEREEQAKRDYAEAARLLEEEEARKREEAARERKRRLEERERLRRERLLAEEKARREAEEEAERLLREQQAAEARAIEERRQRDMAILRPITQELRQFSKQRGERKAIRAAEEERKRQTWEAHEAARRDRAARRNALR